jgi:two-component system, chemotaxis family, sensor kinase CheA
MDDLIREFLCETNESLATLDVELVRLETDTEDTSLIASIFRLMHTIKGTCGFLGLPRLEKVAHSGENVLGKFRDKELSITPAAVTLILKSIDRIRTILMVLEETGAEPEGDDTDLIAELDAAVAPAAQPIIETVAAEASPEILPGNPPENPPENAPENAEETGVPEAAELLAEIASEMAEAPDDAAVAAPQADELEPAKEPEHTVKNRAPKPESETKESAASASSIRVNVDIIENLMTLVSELVLTRNQLLQLQRGISGNEFKVPLQRLTHITGDLQDGITRMRMQPIGNAWAKLPRIVRDLAVETGKKINLVTKGAETELDRQVLEMIKDPLTHMVRNSADHGIEDPAARVAAGKPETGTITLSAYHESGHIFIRIDDDGRGLDTDRIRKKAIENGIATESELAGLSEQRILQLICRPGFSTAEKVTSVSGRGVGMDVVHTNIARIGGTVDMTSARGRGTSFTIKIPLTLAIVSALIVRTAGMRFAIPQINVLELVRLSERNGLKVETIKSAKVLRLRDQLLPLVSLRTLLGEQETAGTGTGQFIIVAQVGKNSFGIIVDRVFDTEEIVVKPVAPILRGTPFYAGNTILGDGSVIMILDPNGLAAAAGQNQIDDADRAAAAAQSAQPASEMHSLLLFRAGGPELKAVPLELVARIEDIEKTTIEQVSDRFVTQYRGHLMPLVPFDDDWPWKDKPKQTVLVFSDNGRDMGLAVNNVVDIIRGRLNVDLAGAKPGLIGSAIIGSKATDIVDIGPFLTRAFADWFEPTHDKTLHHCRNHALVIDDSSFFRNLLTPLLAASDWCVTAAADGAEAMEILENGQSFDLIVSDIDMPEIDGLELARKIRADARWKSVPMIALSSLDRDEDRKAGIAAGYNEYLGKSDHTQLPAKLLHTVERMVPKDRLGKTWRKAS